MVTIMASEGGTKTPSLSHHGAVNKRIRNKKQLKKDKSPKTSTPNNQRIQSRLSSPWQDLNMFSQDPTDMGVCWDYRASPRARARLKKVLNSVEDVSPSKSYTRCKKSPAPFHAKYDIDDDLKQEMEELHNMILNTANNNSNDDENEENVFSDSEDDSFLIKCSQFVENVKPTTPKNHSDSPDLVKQSDKKPNVDVFEDNMEDSFDFLMSQVDMSNLKSTNRSESAKSSYKNISETKTSTTSNSSKTTPINQNKSKTSSLVSNASKTSSVKSLNSNTSKTSSLKSLHSNASTTFKSNSNLIKRTFSSPGIEKKKSSFQRSSTSGSVPRCSIEEIEQKKLEAINRRKQTLKNSQNSQNNKPSPIVADVTKKPTTKILCTKQEIEKKRLEALKKRKKLI